MPAPLGKRTAFDGARRPWNCSPPENVSPAPVGRPPSKKAVAERETCLSCIEPDCPSEQCPLIRRKPKREKLVPPEEFLRWAWTPMTNMEWAEKLGGVPDDDLQVARRVRPDKKIAARASEQDATGGKRENPCSYSIAHGKQKHKRWHGNYYDGRIYSAKAGLHEKNPDEMLE